MKALLLKNTESEAGGTINTYLDEHDIDYTVVDLSNSDLPDHQDFDIVFIFGGPMSVNDEKDYPYLTKEMEMIKERLREDKPVVGICLGSQLIAKAAGAKITKCNEKEIGYFDIELTEEGMEDEIFEDIEQLISVFQWHGETWELPKGGVLLAVGSGCRNQAFRIGSSYGFQFHNEVTEQQIRLWLNIHKEEVAEENIEPEFILADAPRMVRLYKDQMYRILDNLFRKLK